MSTPSSSEHRVASSEHAKRRVRVLIYSLLATHYSLLFLPGCTGTIAPKAAPPPAQASFDGNTKDSGFLGFFADGSGHITPHARDRYNALIALYGHDTTVPLRTDAGIAKLADGTFQIDAEHLAAFLTMAEKKRSGLAPRP